MSTNVFNIIMVFSYIAMIAGAGLFASWMTIQRKKNMERMRGYIKSKLTSPETLSAKDITLIGRGFDLSSKNSRDAVYKLYAEIDDEPSFTALKKLVTEIEKEEPFDDLPDEVKPSLSRLVKLVESSPEASDKHVLLPITSTLNKYTELKLEQDKTKKQASRAYVITIISLIVGTISFYFTLKSPSDEEIKKAVAQALTEHVIAEKTPPKIGETAPKS